MLPNSALTTVRSAFYGKLPSRGDFVQRRMPRELFAAWEPWIAEILTQSRRGLGEAWAELYSASPVWRFSLSPGLCGDQGYAGVLIPSRDRVGRLFPLAIVRSVQPEETAASPLSAARAAWFESTIQLAVQALAEPAMSLEDFDAALLELHPPRPVAEARLGLPAAGVEWRPLAGLAELPADVVEVSRRASAADTGPLSCWWTAGRSSIPAGWFACAGLPDAATFVSMLTGFAPPVSPPASPPESSNVRPNVARTLTSASASHRGKVRGINQDACLEHQELDLWVVADGVGGGRDGERASRAVCDILALLRGAASLEALVAAVQAALQTVNAELLEDGHEYQDTCATTVVVLLVHDGRFAVSWAGDSRVYQWHESRLAQLTTDHNVYEALDRSDAFAGFKDLVVPDGNLITRSVGGADQVELEVRYGELRRGSRFLLCSDGVYRELSDAEIGEILAQADSPADACRRFQEEVLRRAARDNFTALVVDIP